MNPNVNEWFNNWIENTAKETVIYYIYGKPYMYNDEADLVEISEHEAHWIYKTDPLAEIEVLEEV